MQDWNHAQLMISMARKDLSALEHMTNAEIFADEIFGFHAQQAVEKALKGWLSFLGITYPKIHDLEELLALR
jgi:HEPN domain-containing protein